MNNKVTQEIQSFLIRQDWLGINNIFYNTRTGLCANNINDVIDFNSFELDPDGLINYLKFGYCVFGRTPVKDVYFLRQNEVLSKNSEGKFQIFEDEDPCLSYLSLVTSEVDAMEKISSAVQLIANNFKNSNICIPMSGGYDSRLINYFCSEHKHIQAFTYGISFKQSSSFEAVNAKAICEKLNVPWKLIELGKFHDYLPNWVSLYGISTHAHGMYQWEFYEKIKSRYGVMPVISGIVGDVWAGSPNTLEPLVPDDLKNLGYSHGAFADETQCLLKTKEDLITEEFEKKRILLKDERYRVLYLVRTKMILLSYLLKVPSYLGFSAHTPFSDIKVAMSMLTIEPRRWRNRLWQKEFLSKHNLDVECSNSPMLYQNDLDYLGMLERPLEPLRINILSGVFRPKYLEWINSNVIATKWHLGFSHKVLSSGRIGAGLRLFGLKDTALVAYSAYMTIKPIEDLMLKVIENNRTKYL